MIRGFYSATQCRDPNIDHTIVLIFGTPEKVPLILGTPSLSRAVAYATIRTMNQQPDSFRTGGCGLHVNLGFSVLRPSIISQPEDHHGELQRFPFAIPS